MNANNSCFVLGRGGTRNAPCRKAFQERMRYVALVWRSRWLDPSSSGAGARSYLVLRDTIFSIHDIESKQR
jgi:hypothetical protein